MVQAVVSSLGCPLITQSHGQEEDDMEQTVEPKR